MFKWWNHDQERYNSKLHCSFHHAVSFAGIILLRFCSYNGNQTNHIRNVLEFSNDESSLLLFNWESSNSSQYCNAESSFILFNLSSSSAILFLLVLSLMVTFFPLFLLPSSHSEPILSIYSLNVTYGYFLFILTFLSLLDDLLTPSSLPLSSQLYP